MYKSMFHKHAEIARKRNSFLNEEAIRYFQSCFKVCEDMSHSNFQMRQKLDQKCKSLAKVNAEIHEKCSKMNVEINHYYEHAVLQDTRSDFDCLFKEISDTVNKEWKATFTSIESEFKTMVDHVEKYKRQEGLELMSDDRLQIPTQQSCVDGKKCFKCED